MKAMNQKDEKKRPMEVCMTKEQAIEKMRLINSKHDDNVESRKNALNTIINAIPVGGKIFAIVPLEELCVDNTYQRPVQSHVKTIAKEWADVKCDPLKINYREDGNFYVWDGQHRKVAAQMRGIEYLLCDITIGLTVEQEASLFGAQGDGLKKPNPYDIFKAHVRSGDKIDTDIKTACDLFGIEVKKSSAPGCLSCLTISREIFNRGHEDYFYWVLDLLEKAAWYNFPRAYSHCVIYSLYELRKTYVEEYEFVNKKLVDYIKKFSPSEMITKAVARYPQYRDESKSLKMLFVDIIDDNK